MKHLPKNELGRSIFRSNPQYELVLFERLLQEEQETLGSLLQDEDTYGILRPRDGHELRIKSISRDAALLFFTLLYESGPLPEFTKVVLGEKWCKTIAELVLDNILQVQCNGEFLSGIDAYSLIFETEHKSLEHAEIAKLSIEALKYAQTLETLDAPRLSARMYFYNRQPASPEWIRRLPTTMAVTKYLQLQEGGANRMQLQRNWISMALSMPYEERWLMWKSPFTRNRNGISSYKLYVSPKCEDLPEAFRDTIEVLSKMRAHSFKVGKDIFGLLRPDKLVAYFGDLEDLMEAADSLKQQLKGCPAQGVPFTAELAGRGLLSWGIDPPLAQKLIDWHKQESWRLWVTNRLAIALVSAKAKISGSIEPWQFALQRLSLEGIDTDMWVPEQTIWQNNT